MEKETFKSIYAQTDGELRTFDRIVESFTKIVIDYALHDQALLAKMAEKEDIKDITFLVENWYYSQVPVLANDMFNDIMAKGSGFVRLEKVVECLISFKEEKEGEQA